MSIIILNYLKNKNYFILLFITLFIISRVYFISFENNNNSYLDINFNNFFDKLYHHQSTSIGYFILTYFYKSILGNFYTTNNAIIMNSIYSLVSIYLLLKTIKNKNVLTFIIFFIYSILLIPYETWRPFHWDHINLVIISFLIFSYFKFINDKKNYYLLFLSSTLLVLFNSIGIIVFFFILTYIFFIKNLKIKIKLLFLIPIFLILIVMFKNFFISKNFAPTSMGGANLIQRSIHAIGLENYYKMISLNSKKYPEWWLNIHNKIKDKKIKNINTHISVHAHGLLDGPKNRSESFSDLKSSIIQEYKKNNELKKIIDLEESIIKKKINSGIGYNINNIGYYYMTKGKKVFIQACINYPFEMFVGKIGSKGFVLTALQMISHSSLFPRYYESHNVQWNKWLEILNKTFKFVFHILLVCSIFIFFRIIKNKFYNKNIKFYLIICLLTFLFVSLTSIITCCENPRLMVMYSPMIIYICYFNIVNFISFKNI